VEKANEVFAFHRHKIVMNRALSRMFADPTSGALPIPDGTADAVTLIDADPASDPPAKRVNTGVKLSAALPCNLPDMNKLPTPPNAIDVAPNIAPAAPTCPCALTENPS
jgi:hypothetical protein